MDETCGDAEGKAGGGGGVEEDMEVGECSEEEEDEEEDIDLGSSPITDNSSVIMSMTSPAAPTAYEGLASPLRVVPGVISGGKPVGIKRGPGRPRGPGSRGGGTGAVRVKKPSNQPPKLKRWKGLLVSGVYSGSNGKTPGENGEEESTSPVQPSTPVELKTPIFVDEPLFQEQWPGKVCVLCNLTEHSQLGQGKMCRIECTVEELPKEIPKELLMSPPETPPIDATSPRHQAQLFQNRRQKGMSKFRNAHGSGQEPVDELSLVGHTDAPEPSNIVDAGFIYVHEWCASWCAGITKKHDNSFLNVPFAVMAAANRRCYHCSRYGAGGACIVPSCNKHFHTPCAAAAATFQYTESLILICSQHIEHVETNSALSGVVCYSCNALGNVANLVMCSMCGKHHHGACIGNSLQPGLRAGWQCAECRICQLCRQCEDTNRMLVCDSCDKAYHPYCVKPAMSSVPKVGWKCKRCRLCSDCGARTPGGGLSSRWHSNYTVCDSCYQQRNKGFSCPVCHKAYRAAALREMVRCSQCQRFVHGTCDKEADFVSYHRKKEAHPDYEYICLSCKNNSTVHFMKRKDSTDDIQFDSNLSVSQESLMANDDADGDSEKSDDTSMRFSMVGLGKGKPFYATKIAKKRLGLSSGPGRPKGSGKLPSVTSALSNFQKKHKFSDFGRKRGSKTKIRGMFGVPGLALQSPTWSSSDPAPKSGDDEPGCENKIILCASKEKFVLGQDVCVMCGALGIDQEACLICCSQCGQCFHPYCVTVKVTKVMLTRGWRCLDCTVCEGCGQRNDEARLILCDDCDISYHIYCMDPPMGSVPTGGWKCKWCAQCLTCGATSPGINSNWQSNFSQCGACASRTTCPACYELYTDGDLIIKCINCDRWLHCLCDTITTEQEAEAYCSQGYTCVLCRPANMPLAPPVTPTRAPSPEFPTEGKANDYYVDGVCLSETGLQQIKTLELENSNQPVRRKRPGFKRSQENDLLNLDDGENENPNPVYKDGMVWGSKENGPVPSPPEGFSLSTSESGVVILKRKKQRNLQKLGIGGFSAVKMRSSRFKDDEEGLNTFGEDKPRRKPRCTKKRSKLAESYPSYLQEAFFGRELLDITKESTQELESEESEESDGEKPKVDHDKTISLSQDELKVMADVTAKKEKEELARNSPCVSVKEEDMSDSENFKDILHLPDNLLHNDLVNTIMNERDGIKSEIDSGTHESNGDQKDELSEILGPNFSLDSIQTGLPNMDSKDVEEIFKGVLTHESQDAHRTSPLVPRGSTPGTPSQSQVSPQQGLPSAVLSRSGSVTPAVHPNLSSPMGFPSASPYNSEYSNSPQFSPEGSPWGGDENANNHKNSLRMEQDEALGQHATIAAVLYANINCPELKQECPSWPERFKQVLRKWRNLPNEKRAPYVQLAKDNRTNVRIKKTQQDQDKTTLNKTSREAEQERWKAMQVLRQQTLQFAQTRAAVPPRLQRQLSNEGSNLVQYSPDNPNAQAPPTQPLLVSTPQEPSGPTALGGLGSPRPPQFSTPGGIKTVRQAPPGTVYARTVLRPPGPPASPFSPPRQPPPEEMNRQLRDLLKGQHIKQETVIGENSVLATTSAAGQIRAQLAQVRTQQPLHQPNVQGVMDARVRYHLLQQSRPSFPGSPVRLPAPRQQLEQFNAMVQRQQQFAQAANSSGSAIVRTPQQQQQQLVDQSARIQLESRLAAANRDGEEIPDSVTAELEKLEQEGGSIAEAEAVSAILGDLVEDDDDALLAEMGADFNILAYADPELDDITDGDKTNLHIPHLDDLEEEVEKKKQSNANEAKPAEAPQASNEQKPQLPQPKEEAPQPSQIVLPNRTPPTSLPVSVVATNNMAPSPPVTQQGTLVNHVLPAAKDKTFTPFVTPNTPLPRMQLMPGGVTSPRAQQSGAPIPGAQNPGFIQISPPPPYPGPPPPYPGQMQSTIRVGGPKVARSALPPLSAAAPRRSLLLQEQPLLLEDLLEEEKREQEQRSGTPVQGPSSGTSLMSDADFEMLRADVLGTTTQVSSPPQIPSVPLLNITIQPAPPLPPENIVTEQDRQMQIQYEQWLVSNNSAVTQQLKYYETEVTKLRKIRKSLNSKKRQLAKNGNPMSAKDLGELQRITLETTALTKHLETARKQSRTHSIVMQEYQNKQDQKNVGIASSVITANVLVSQGMDSSSPQSPNGMPPGLQQQQSMLPSPQTSASPLHHSPRIGTPHSQSGDDKSDNGLASPRPPPMAPTPPSPHQFHQIRHPGMVPRFARSPEGQPRPRLVLQSTQNSAMYSAPRAFVTSPQSPSLSPQNVIPSRLTPQHQQLLIQRHQLQQQKRELLLRQEALQEGLIPRQLQSQESVGLIQRQLQTQDGVRQIQTQDGVGLIPRQLQTQEGVGLIQRQLQTQEGVQRQVLIRQGLIQDDGTLTTQEQQQQLQALQQRQQQLQQNRQQLIMTQQGKVAQYRQLIQQPSTLIQANQMQSPTNTNQQLISQFASSSPVPPSPMQSPSPISTSMSNTPQYSTSSSPLHPPPSPMLSQFQNPSSSPMPQQSPRVQNYQTANSPMTPQSPMVYSGLQTPTSPMPQFNQPNSPMPPHSPRVQQQYGQPPSSPMGSNSQNSMMQQQYVHRPNSPMVPMGSPMPMRRPSSTGGSIASSPAAERPQSVEPRTPQEQDVNNMLGGGGGGGGGGGNPYLPFNPIPFPPELYRDGYLKIGLKGGSPMWSDKTLPRKPLLKGKVGQPSPGTSANNDEKSRKSLVSVDYNDFDEESTPPTTPPVKAALIKKSDGPVKTRQSEDTDSELTVYDDIVLVEGCKEGNLEVEELQSALENNVMSTVVSMPMMIDDPDILDDCLVSSSDLVVLDVDSTNNDTDCILGKDDENMLLLDEDISDGLKVDDELMELDEDLPSSPPLGRKRISGKVLPGHSIHQEDQKQTPDSPDDSSVDTIKDRNEQVTSSGEEKVKAEDKMKSDSAKSQDVIMDRNVPTSVQPNVVVSRNSAAFTPISTQKSIPVCSERHLSKQQAAIASLVQDAVNAAKLAAAEAQNSQKTPSTDAGNASSSHVFSRPLNIVHGGRGPQNQYLSSAVITNKIENQLAGGSELIKKDGKTIKLEPSSPDHSPTKSEPRTYQENSIPLEHRNRIMEYLKSDEPPGASERDPIKNFGLPNKRPNLILKLEENNEGEGGSKMSLRLDNSLRGMDRNTIQKNSSMIFNLVSDKSDGTEKSEMKFSDRGKQQHMTESPYNSNRGEQVTLPAVSSSILEAQLTSMLRSSASDPPTSSNQKIIYAIVNHNNKEPSQQRENPSPHDEIKVEGLAAHLQRTIKSEAEVRMNENDIIRNAKIHQNYKPGLYVPSKIKSDSFIVGGTHYKVYTGSQGDNLVVPSEENKTQNHYMNKVVDNNSNNHPQVIVKQEPGLSCINKPKPTDRFTSSEALQQRVVSSSELPQMLNEKETHHVSFSGAKVMQKDEPKKFVSLSNMLMPRRDSDEGKGNLRFSRTPDDSQNVLLKQLLQNTACATSNQSPQPPSLPIVPSLEAQLARPVPPTPSSLIPPLLNEPPKPPAAVKDIPSSPQTPKPPSVPHTPTTPELTRAPSTASCLDELLSPPPLPPTTSSLQGGPVIKREPMTSSMPPQGSTSPMTSPMEIKKEVVPVNVPVAVEVKKEVVSSDEMLSPGLRMEQETPGDPTQDIKKQKRRLYQQKRRQSLGKESVGGTPKKRPRKSSKVEEDYDSFIDSLMLQLRQIPTTMTICEPNLTYNFTGSPVFGSGDLSKVNSCTRLGELRGTYGNAYLPHENDYYNTIPFGDLPPKAPSAPSTQRGFYNEEFAPLKLHATKDEFDDRKYDYNRDTNDTPDTIVSSSSPECIMPEFPTRYPGLQFIDSDSEDEKLKPSRFSPDIPIISPLVVRPKPIRFYSDMDKENEGPQGKKHCDNVTVTLTLNSQAADDVLSVLRNLANVLRIPVPVHYSITERMSKPSHRLGMCKIRSKDGKEGGQVDIQSILNGSTKFCRHCEVVITNNLMRKKASDLPLVAKQGEDELYFCSTACYMQLAMAHPAPVHQEKKPTSTEVPPFMGTRGAGKRESRTSIDKAIAPPVKKAPSRYRVWTSMTIPPPSSRHKKPTEKEITEMMFKCGIPLAPPKLPEDTRTCLFCHQMGDGVTHGPARLLNYDVNKWVHLNCALWSDEVYETTNGGLVNVEQALQNGSSASCAYCNTTGATLKCYKIRCSVVYHLPCAVKDACVFYKNKTLYCASHVPKNEKENELTTLSVMRRVYIQRDEPRQIASIMHNTEQNNLLRVGSLTFLSVGQLLPHQLQNFHTPNYIYPIGYKILRMYWSMRVANRRCKYICSIHESEGRPEFRIVVQERGEQDLELKDSTARGVWLKVLEPLAELRRNDTLVKMFSKYITGEDLFGLTEPVVVRVLESLPGIDTLTDYKFKYGKNPFLELPLAINPTGCARSEVRPKGPGVMRKAHTQRTSSVSYRPSQSPSISIPGEPLCPYSKQFVHSKSSQYKKMKQEWRNNVYLARSKIQGLGLYAARDLEKHTMVIEYIGEIIRTEVAETREKQYEAKNRGIYMFRLDEDRVVDATLSGGLARYINHSCYPNCVAETVEVERDLRIIIFTKRRISRGEELAYDYKFDIEDDQHKIPCMCGAPNCRKWMN